ARESGGGQAEIRFFYAISDEGEENEWKKKEAPSQYRGRFLLAVNWAVEPVWDGNTVWDGNDGNDGN
ncbi:MAG TPA: hypothetical protein VGU68_02200, partial [Ktedonobacteraceae bacterium]|nr:hypothetical protein [Ktedonobacteraceae bacterium]